MRRTLFATAALALIVLVLAATPAFAKFENAQITITGPGLSAPIQLSGYDAALWERYSGVFEPKWQTPNVEGRPAADTDLGPAYRAEVSFDCGDQAPGAFAETLYPYAPGGPQIFTGSGARFCGITASPGYFPASVRLLHLLVSRGLPRTAPDAGTPTDAAGLTTSAGGSTSTTVALAGLFALAAAAAVAAVRRRGRTTA